jgi:hypothetical protein
MKTHPNNLLYPVCLSLLLVSCAPDSKTSERPDHQIGNEKGQPRQISEETKAYWFGGEAEITSYHLEQARYGELREGHAVLIFVTEPFLPGKQVKADEHHPDNIQVLKLNKTKKFLTGIYPYSIMSSVFYPVSNREHAIKLSTSVQEWCGHIYTQLNNRPEGFEIDAHSYFEKEADMQLRLSKTWLEDELWTLLRLNPDELPTGSVKIVPSLEFLRLSHRELKSYTATASLTRNGQATTFELIYPELERTLRIQFESSFPYIIDTWTEAYKSGFGPNEKMMVSTARKNKTLKTAYWQENRNKDVVLRDSLGL